MCDDFFFVKAIKEGNFFLMEEVAKNNVNFRYATGEDPLGKLCKLCSYISIWKSTWLVQYASEGLILYTLHIIWCANLAVL